MFLGTPHEGGQGVALAQSVGNIAKLYYQTTDRLLKNLEEHSEWLDELAQQYKSIIGDFQTVFCFEDYETPIIGGKRILVSPTYPKVSCD